jgi:CDP-paratose 2-epimerase
MSCIAGPRQFGTEDQGWVAHFIYSVLERKPITIYGNGFQVRDILHVQDLVNAIQSVRERRSRTRGEIFNLGGGLERAVSIAEMLDAIRRETGLEPILKYSEVRPGDQPLYISDTSRLTEYTGWRARHSWLQTLRSIQKFWNENQRMLADHRDAVVLPEFAVAEVA